MSKTSLAITGLGNVGRSLLQLIQRQRGLLRSRFDLELVLAGACDSSGARIDSNGLDIDEIISIKQEKKGLAGIAGMAPNEFARSVEADILVELTLTNLQHGEPGLSTIRCALDRKMNVVTANKGPLVVAYPELSVLAKSNQVKLLYSAAVTGGLPTLNVGTRDLCAATILKVEGVFNGTTNYILTRMAEGISYSDALQHAQKVGMAEADPTLDVDGWDAACKLVIIANAVLGRPTKLSDVVVEGIREVTPQQLQLAASRDQVIKLIACADRQGNDYQLSVRPTMLDFSHPLAHVGANMMAVVYETDINGKIFASIVEPDPIPTAAAVLRDIVHIAAKR
jgi:homoserine dehydrogenase